MGDDFNRQFPFLPGHFHHPGTPNGKPDHEANMPRNQRSSKHKNQQVRRPRGWLIFGAVLILLLIALAAVYFGGDSSQAALPSNTQASLPLEISVQEAYPEYQARAFFLDVREQAEWDEFHIPGASLIPLGELPDRLNELPRDRKIVVGSRSGNRSRQGRDILLNAGFTNVTSMVSGLTGWSIAGYPIEGTRP
jgi:rhodanese-related sulfurtransferase